MTPKRGTTKSSFLVIFHRCLLLCLKQIVATSQSLQRSAVLRHKNTIVLRIKVDQNKFPCLVPALQTTILSLFHCFLLLFFVLLCFVCELITMFPAYFLSLEDDSHLCLCYDTNARPSNESRAKTGGYLHLEDQRQVRAR